MSDVIKVNVNESGKEKLPISISLPIKKSTLSSIENYIRGMVQTLILYMIVIIFFGTVVISSGVLGMIIGAFISSMGMGTMIESSSLFTINTALMPIPLICEIISMIISSVWLLTEFGIVKLAYKEEL